MLLFYLWKRFSHPVTLNAIVAIVVIAFACTFLTTPAGGGWDSASSHLVTVDVYDVYGEYCGAIGLNYYVPDTTTQHYMTYHVGPDWTTPPDHPFPHTGTITEVVKHQIDKDLDTLCDGTHPLDGLYYCACNRGAVLTSKLANLL